MSRWTKRVGPGVSDWIGLAVLGVASVALGSTVGIAMLGVFR